MPKISAATKRAIKRDLVKYNYWIEPIKKKYSVSIPTILRLQDELFATIDKEGIVASHEDNIIHDPKGVHFGTKDKPYQTEEQMLSSPYYGATNKGIITPINKDWKLYK